MDLNNYQIIVTDYFVTMHHYVLDMDDHVFLHI